MIEVKNISFSYGRKPILTDVGFTAQLLHHIRSNGRIRIVSIFAKHLDILIFRFIDFHILENLFNSVCFTM